MMMDVMLHFFTASPFVVSVPFAKAILAPVSHQLPLKVPSAIQPSVQVDVSPPEPVPELVGTEPLAILNFIAAVI
jgi:hypothetical protein